MNETPKRARRRIAMARMKRKARKIYPHDKQAKDANHLAVCSCLGCGNGRRHSGRGTLQELRADLASDQGDIDNDI
jgi:hypothetical protein